MFQKNDSSLYKGAYVGQPQGLSLRLCVIIGLRFFVLQKIVRVRIPLIICKKTKGTANAIPCFLWRRARDSAQFVRRKVCYANYPDYRLLLTRLRLAKDYKGSNSINNLQKNKGYSKCYTLYFMAESKGFFRRTAVRLRIASLFNHGLSNSPPDCFHRQSRPSLFESLA